MLFSESNAAWVACVVSACALALSLYTLAKNRNSLNLYLGFDQDGDCIGGGGFEGGSMVPIGKYGLVGAVFRLKSPLGS